MKVCRSRLEELFDFPRNGELSFYFGKETKTMKSLLMKIVAAAARQIRWDGFHVKLDSSGYLAPHIDGTAIYFK